MVKDPSSQTRLSPSWGYGSAITGPAIPRVLNASITTDDAPTANTSWDWALFFFSKVNSDFTFVVYWNVLTRLIIVISAIIIAAAAAQPSCFEFQSVANGINNPPCRYQAATTEHGWTPCLPTQLFEQNLCTAERYQWWDTIGGYWSGYWWRTQGMNCARIVHQ